MYVAVRSAKVDILSSCHSLTKSKLWSVKKKKVIFSLCHKTLIRDFPTKWNSSYLILDHLLKAKCSLSTVFDEIGCYNKLRQTVNGDKFNMLTGC